VFQPAHFAPPSPRCATSQRRDKSDVSSDLAIGSLEAISKNSANERLASEPGARRGAWGPRERVSRGIRGAKPLGQD
jgi:hypothetical protein